MSLERFLTRTAAVDPCVLRRAVAAALPVEAPHNAECYAGFYSRVVSELEDTVRSGHAPSGDSLEHAKEQERQEWGLCRSRLTP
jgi:hypothetical protein